ncbi:MAG: NAD(P)/FAD-dependent oxidoreductase [Thermomicrobiales bacterium]
MVRLQPVHVAATRSLWLQEALALEPEAGSAEPLGGAHRTDVCIVGGGYTGLWTALRIKELDPSVEVMVLEADICGGGASGRNGGLVLGWYAKIESLIKVCGEEEAVRLVRSCGAAVSEIGEFCRLHSIDAHYRHSGWLRTATTPLHMGLWAASIRTCERLGFDVHERLGPEEVARRTGSPVHLGGVLERDAGTVQPALLARGLRRVAIERGVRVYEHTPVTELSPGRPPVVRTPRAAVVADKVILATNAWAAGLHELRRAIVALSSDMIATAPMPERLHEIGWTGGECITDARLMVHYYQTTRDGRVAIGRGSGALAYLGRIGPTFNQNDDRAAVVDRGLRRLYPALANVPITHAWAGAVDRSRTNTLIFGKFSENPNVLYGVGYSGTGVAPSLIGGRILASTALDRVDEWSTCRLNQGPLVLFPPEPARFFGGLLVREATRRKEEGEERSEAAPGLVNVLASLALPRYPKKR